MTNDQYHSYKEKYKGYNANYSQLYSTKLPSYNLSDGRTMHQYTSIDDLVEPTWFEKITELMESDKKHIAKAENTKKYKYRYFS